MCEGLTSDSRTGLLPFAEILKARELGHKFSDLRQSADCVLHVHEADEES